MLIHGCSKSKLFFIWDGMIRRCHNPKHKSFPGYGGRGIAVCESWRQSFSVFKAWSIAAGYTEGLSIDRIDNDGGYQPSNCRWADVETQQNNKSTNIVLSAFGECKTVAQWARDSRCRVQRCTLLVRHHLGWPDEFAISKPAGARYFNMGPTRKLSDVTVREIRLSTEDQYAVAMRLGISQATVSRVRSGKQYADVS